MLNHKYLLAKKWRRYSTERAPQSSRKRNIYGQTHPADRSRRSSSRSGSSTARRTAGTETRRTGARATSAPAGASRPAWLWTPARCGTKLKGSIGEGPNHSNFSDQNSVKICQNSGDLASSRRKKIYSLNYSEIQKLANNATLFKLFSTFSKLFGEIPEFFIKISMRIVEK